MHQLNSQRSLFVCGLATLVVGLVSLGGAIGIFSQTGQSEANPLDAVEQMLLNADTATRGQNMSLATGQISNDVEGLFVLDHLTGNLSCIVLSPRNGTAGGSLFVTNVNQDLGAGKAGQNDYLMTTGFINANRGGRSGRTRIANSVVYVADGNTGQVAGYTLAYDQTNLDAGQGQGGTLQLVWKGASREGALRREQN